LAFDDHFGQRIRRWLSENDAGSKDSTGNKAAQSIHHKTSLQTGALTDVQEIGSVITGDK
jgi:hypothetical protein